MTNGSTHIYLFYLLIYMGKLQGHNPLKQSHEKIHFSALYNIKLTL